MAKAPTKSKANKRQGKDTPKEQNQNTRTYYKGVKQPLPQRSKLTRTVINKTFKTDDELNGFILKEGTFKDRLNAMTLVTIKELDETAAKQLLSIAETEGGDKSYLALTYAIKIISYYDAVVKEEESSPFVAFIDKIRFVKRLTDAFRLQMASPFLQKKVAMLIKNLVSSDILAVQMVDLLIEVNDSSMQKETLAVIDLIIKKKNFTLLDIIKEKIVQTVLYHKNLKKTKTMMTLAHHLTRKDWVRKPEDYKEYIVPLIRGYTAMLKKLYEGMYSPRPDPTIRISSVKLVLDGILRFLLWERFLPAGFLPETRVSKFVKECGYMIFKLAYHDNTKYSFPALTILEIASETEKINYVKVLIDTVKKYIYLNETPRCELLNKAINQKDPEVQDRIVKSSYIYQIGGKYPLGCQMLAHECCPTFQSRLGLMLHRKSYDPDVSKNAEALLRGDTIEVYNLWC
ncbi:hypothetical protein NEDG_00498 [Nematocida displodere]|uniref:Uncharacterized protein n=1 Tax=Nematocida displodere TaxID=1805483 RepID=A0A177EJ72_9MICR|nr:hypothetical protein NEDG_00498 [Nematocida displodere]